MDEDTASSANIDEVNLLDYCRVVWKRNGLIVALCATSILIALVFSLRAPKYYRATATILPPMEIGVQAGNSISLQLGGG